jgi:hypothetical protein
METKELAEELLKLDTKFSSQRIDEVTKDNYKELIPDIADLDDEIEKEILCKQLAKRLDVNYRTVRNTVKAYERDKEPAIKDNNIIAHPSYHIDHDFISLGFRETVVIDSKPEDKNFYVISNQKGIYLHESKVLQYIDKTIIFDERDRLLIRHEDRWKKNRIESFVKNPVLPEGLYHEIKLILKQYIELPKEAVYGLLSSWIIATYFFQIFYAFPFLFIYGKKQSGKSRLLNLLERLVFNAMKIKGVSVASLADSIDGVRGVFLNDQAEALSDSKNIEILGIIADSYTRGGGNRRIVDISNKKRRVLDFETYSPKAFASTKEIDPDIEDRCIEITMIRAMKDYPEPEAFLPIWQDLRDKLYRLLLTRWQDVKATYVNTGEGVSQRIRELWRPIETILRLENVSTEEMEAIKEFFLESMMETQSELSDNEQEFFETLLTLLKNKREGILTAKEIVEKIIENRKKQNENEPISEKGLQITEKGLQIWVGRIIRQFSLYDYQAGRKGKSRAYKFTYDHVKDIFNRYTIRSNGFNGNMVQTLDNQPFIIDHSENVNGFNGHINGISDHSGEAETIGLPLKTIEKNQMVASKALTNKAIDHLTIKTINPEGVKEIIIEGEQ